MIKSTEQIRGTCQVCQHDVAVTKGLVAKHGYEVSMGFFNGTCMGAGYVPFEVGTDALERYRVAVVKMLAEQEAYVIRLRAGLVTEVTRVERDYNTKSGSKVVTYKAPEPPRGHISWERFMDSFTHGQERREASLREHLAEVNARLAAWVARPEALRTVKLVSAAAVPFGLTERQWEALKRIALAEDTKAAVNETHGREVTALRKRRLLSFTGGWVVREEAVKRVREEAEKQARGE